MSQFNPSHQQRLYHVPYFPSIPQPGQPPSGQTMSTLDVSLQKMHSVHPSPAYITGTVLPPPSHHSLGAHPHSANLSTQHLYVKEGGYPTAVPASQPYPLGIYEHPPPTPQGISPHPSVAPPRAMLSSKGAYMYVNTSSTPPATAAVPAPSYMMTTAGNAPIHPQHQISVAAPSHILMHNHHGHYATVQTHSTHHINSSALQEVGATKFGNNLVPSSSHASTPPPTPSCPPPPTPTCVDTSQTKPLLNKGKVTSTVTSISNSGSYAKSPCPPSFSSLPNTERPHLQSINGEGEGLSKSGTPISSPAAVARFPMHSHLRCASSSPFKTSSPSGNGCSSPTIPGPNGLRYPPTTAAPPVSINDVRSLHGPTVPHSANPTSESLTASSTMVTSSHIGEPVNGSCAAPSPSSVTCNKMNVNKLEGTITDVLNLALSNDPHDDIFALHERKPTIQAPEHAEFKVPNHVDVLQHVSVSTSSALSVTTSSASSPRLEKRSSVTDSGVTVNASAPPIPSNTVSTTPLQITTTVALSPCSISSSYTWNRGATSYPTHSSRSLSTDSPISSEPRQQAPPFTTKFCSSNTKKRKNVTKLPQGETNKKIKLSLGLSGNPLNIKSQQQQHFTVFSGNQEEGSMNPINGVNSPFNAHGTQPHEPSFPSAAQQLEQQNKLKFENLSQFTRRYFTEMATFQKRFGQVDPALSLHHPPPISDVRVSHCFTMPVLMQLRPLAFLGSSWLRANAMSFDQSAKLELSREQSVGKYQMPLFQPHIIKPKNHIEIDRFLFHNRLLNPADVPKSEVLCKSVPSSFSNMKEAHPESQMDEKNDELEMPKTPSEQSVEDKLETIYSNIINSTTSASEGMSRDRISNMNGHVNPRRPSTPPLPVKHIPYPRPYFHLEALPNAALGSSVTKSIRSAETKKVTPSISTEESIYASLVCDQDLCTNENPYNLEDLKHPQPLRCSYCSQIIDVNLNRSISANSSELLGEKAMKMCSSNQTNHERVSFCTRICYFHFKRWYRLWKYNVPEARIGPRSRYVLPSVLLQGSLKIRAKIPALIQLVVPPKEEDAVAIKSEELLVQKSHWKRIFRCEDMESPTIKARRRELDTLQKLAISGCSLKSSVSKGLFDTRECMLCRRCGQEKQWGRFIAFGTSYRWLHQYCAAWSISSPRISANSNANDFIYVSDWTLQEALRGVCDVCGDNGAGRECELCAQHYHLPCACEGGRDITLDTDGRFYCPEHSYIPVSECQRASLKDTIQRNVPRVILSGDRFTPIADFLREGGCSGSGLLAAPWNMRLGGLLIERIGHISPRAVYTGKFHNLRYIYPLGYRAHRYFWSCIHPMRRAVYLCEIDAVYSDSGEREEIGPLFRVTVTEDDNPMEDVKPRIYMNASCDVLWQEILQSIQSLQKRHCLYRLHPHRTRGETLFGLEEPVVVQAIESLPGAMSLNTYQFTYTRQTLIPDLPVYSDDRGSSHVRPCPGSHFQRREAYTFPIEAQLGPCRLGGPLSVPCLPVTIVDPSEHDVSMLMKQRKQHLQEKLLTLRREEWETHVYIAPSRVQGFGVFAAKDFDVGHFIIRYVGECLRLAVANRRLAHYRRHRRCAYFLRLGADLLLDSTVSGGAGRYVQHSCQPNCRLEVFETHSGKDVVFVARRRIFRTEELTCDYASFLMPTSSSNNNTS